jgi:3-phosphoshikimate 1-carboxyvinyltransferase
VSGAATVAVSTVLRAPATMRGTISVPSDKSIAHRALICAALASDASTIRVSMPGADVRSTAAALARFGVRIDRGANTGGTTTFRIVGAADGDGIAALGPGAAYCGNSGTTMRLLAGALASGAGPSVLSGDASLSGRPMERVAEPLRAMGAGVATTDGHAPLTIHGRRPLLPLAHEPATASAQVLGAICLAALAVDGTTTVRVPGPTRDHTERLLAEMGARISRADAAGGEGGATLTTVQGPATLRGLDVDIPGDFSSAAAWIVAATLHPDAHITITGVGLNPSRTALVDVLARMGADISLQQREPMGGEPVGDVVVRTAPRLKATSIGAGEVPALIDELPLLAVAMAAAEGESEVHGASELRLKESDRIAAVAAALDAIGARVEELPDGWRIGRDAPADGAIVTHGDHRVAMAFAVAGWAGVARTTRIDDTACVAVSYPSFFSDATTLGMLR